MGKLNKSEIIGVLKTEMDKRGIKKTALEKQTGLSRKTIGEALKKDGNPTIDTLMKITNALGFELKLIDRNDNNIICLENNKEWFNKYNTSTKKQIQVKDLKQLLKYRDNYNEYKNYLFGYSHDTNSLKKDSEPRIVREYGLIDYYKEIDAIIEYNYKYLSEIAYDCINALKDLCDMLDLDDPKNADEIIDLDIIDNIINTVDSLRGQAEYYKDITDDIFDNCLDNIRDLIEECIENPKQQDNDFWN